MKGGLASGDLLLLMMFPGTELHTQSLLPLGSLRTAQTCKDACEDGQSHHVCTARASGSLAWLVAQTPL